MPGTLRLSQAFNHIDQQLWLPGIFVRHFSDYPDTSFERDRYQDLLDSMRLPQADMDDMANNLDAIESLHTKIVSYQKKLVVGDYQGAIYSAAIEIKQLSQSIYEITKFSDLPLSKRLHDTLNQLSKPYLRQAAQGLVQSEDEVKLNQQNTRLRFAEQAYIHQDDSSNQKLADLLKNIKKLFQDITPPRSCFISYAWPTRQYPDEVYLQPFLVGLHEHLNHAGIRTYLDIKDNTPDASIPIFANQLLETSHVLLICSESLKDKHESPSSRVVQSELSLIKQRHDRDVKISGHTSIYPALLSGEFGFAHPPEYMLYHTVRSFRDQHYLEHLQDFIEWVYLGVSHPIEPQDKQQLRVAYQALWQSIQAPELQADQLDDLLSYHTRASQSLQSTVAYQASSQGQPLLRFKHDDPLKDHREPSSYQSAHSVQSNPASVFQRPPDNQRYFVSREHCAWMRERFDANAATTYAIAIHGMGGMGKTQLAIDYFLNTTQPYTLKAWFTATSVQELQLQYIDLASIMPGAPKLHEGMAVEIRAHQVKSWLEQHSHALLVYDDAPDMATLEDWLPEGYHHILVTSRHSADLWFGHDSTLDVDVMTPEQAVALIHKMTGMHKGDLNLTALVETLGCLPLAVAQAAVVMGRDGQSMGVDDYLEAFRTTRAKLLDMGRLPKPVRHQSLWTTLDISTQSLTPQAKTLLNYLAWLAPHDIPEKLVKAFLQGESSWQAIKKALLQGEPSWQAIKEELNSQTLLRTNPSSDVPAAIHMHALVQDFLRDLQGEKAETVLVHCCEVFNKYYWDGYAAGKAQEHSLLPHAECLHAHTQTTAALPNTLFAKSPLIATEPSCLGAIYLRLGNYQAAKNIYTQCLPIVKAYYGDQNIGIAGTLNNLANTENYLGHAGRAKPFLEQALVITKAHHGDQHPEVAAILNNLALVKNYLGHPAYAEQLLKQALVIRKEHYGEQHPEVAATLNNLANTEINLGHPECAKPLLEQALVMQKKYYGDQHPRVATMLNNLATAENYLGHPVYAQRLYEQALVIRKEHYGEQHPLVARILGYFANTHIDLGNLSGAKTQLAFALPILQSHYGPRHVLTAWALKILAKAERLSGDPGQAKAHLEHVLTIRRAAYGLWHPLVGNTYFNLGLCACDLGDKEKALLFIKAAEAIYRLKTFPEHPQLRRIQQAIQDRVCDPKPGDEPPASPAVPRPLSTCKKHLFHPDAKKAQAKMHDELDLNSPMRRS
jgi:hypothetical protein